MATKKMPVMTSVIAIVSSIRFQFDASGVRPQGVTSWNITDPMTIRRSATAMAMCVLWRRHSVRAALLVDPPGLKSHVGQHHCQTEHQVGNEGGPAAQLGDPREQG